VEDITFDNDVFHLDPIPDNIQNDNVDIVDVDDCNVRNSIDIAFDELHEVHKQVMEDLDCGDALHREAMGSNDVEDNDENSNDIIDRVEELYAQAIKE
jgi:hypothetical protein